MITVALLVYAALVTASSRLLLRSRWSTRSPAWGIWAWQTTSISVAMALVLAGVTAVLPVTPLADEFVALLRTCSHALVEHYQAPGGSVAAALGLVLSVAILVRFTALSVRELRGAARRRAAQRAALTLVAVDDPRGFSVLEAAVPLVYCLPGRTRTVVVTRGVLDTLSTHQLDLVLAHERRHLVMRHHLALSLATALSRTFGGVGVFGTAEARIAALTEMQADDAVVSPSDRRDLAGALAALVPMPQGAALGAVTPGPGAEARERLDRLQTRGPEVRWLRRMALAGAGATLLAAPLALTFSPAVEVAVGPCCADTVTGVGTRH